MGFVPPAGGENLELAHLLTSEEAAFSQDPLIAQPCGGYSAHSHPQGHKPHSVAMALTGLGPALSSQSMKQSGKQVCREEH